MASEQETEGLAALYKEAWDELRRYIYDREPERREKVIERYQGRIAAWNTCTAAQPEREAVAGLVEETARLQAAKERVQRCRDELTFAIEQMVDVHVVLTALKGNPSDGK